MARAKKVGRSSRPAKRKSVSASDKVETRKVDTNRKLIDPNRLLHHVNTVKGYKDKINNLTGHLRKAFQVMKAEGIRPEVVRELIALEKSDQLESREYFEQIGVGVKALGLTFQMALFDVAYDSPVDQAKAEAKAAASAGHSPDNRWPEGSPEAEAYAKTYHETQAKMVPGADKLTEPEREEAVKKGRQLKVVKQEPDFVG